MKSFLFCFVFVLGFDAKAQGSFKSGYIATSRGELFVMQKKATAKAPTFVLVNGLTYTHKSWNPFVDEILKIHPGAGVVQFDLRGMGKTLEKQKPLNYSLDFRDQILDMKALFKKLNIKGEKYLVGLSYGGGLTIDYARKFQKDFDGYIPIAPYLEPLEAHVSWIMQKIRETRLMFPLNPSTDDELYAYFLKILVYTTFPLAEPLHINDYNLEAAYRMSLGATNFNVKSIIDELPIKKMHMIYAGEDEYVHKSKFEELEKLTIKNKVQWASWTEIKEAKHKVPNEWPDTLAQSIFKVLELTKGRSSPLQLEVDRDSQTIKKVSATKVRPLELSTSSVRCEELFSVQ